MQLVGATRSYIRKPFLIKSIWHGVIGSFLALALLIVILYLAAENIPEVYGISDLQLYVIIFFIVICLGIIFSNIATFFAVNKYLSIDEADLYKF